MLFISAVLFDALKLIGRWKARSKSNFVVYNPKTMGLTSRSSDSGFRLIKLSRTLGLFLHTVQLCL